MSADWFDSMFDTNSTTSSPSAEDVNVNATSNHTAVVSVIVAATDRFTIGQMVLIVAIAGTTSVVTVVGNVMVMVSFKIDKQLQTISNYFLFSLAVADLIVGLFSMPLFTLYTIVGYWPLGPHVCDFWLALDYLASNASVLNLLLISFDRYFSVTRPLTYRAKRSDAKAAYMIAGAWVFSLFLWPPWIYAWPYIEGKRTVPDTECYIQFIKTNQYITFGTAIMAFYCPVTVMCGLYWRIWRETEKRQKELPALQGGKQDNSKRSNSSDEQIPITELDGWPKQRSCSNTIQVETEIDSICSKSLRGKNLRKTKSSRLREWCVAWWHSGQEEEFEAEEYWEDDAVSEAGFNTSLSAETPLGQSASRCASSNKNPVVVLPEIAQKPITPSSRSQSKDSVYTILIRLPAAEMEPVSADGPSIRMIQEEKEAAAAATPAAPPEIVVAPPPAQTPRPSVAISAAPSSSSSLGAVRRSCNLADLRIPLNAKGVDRQAGGPKSAVPKAPAVCTPAGTAPKKKKKTAEKKADKKAAKTLSAILLAFIITWTPYNILVLLKPLTSFPEVISGGLWDFFYFLCYINSMVNPLCYALCNASFRRTYMRILSCKWKKRRHVPTNRAFYN